MQDRALVSDETDSFNLNCTVISQEDGSFKILNTSSHSSILVDSNFFKSFAQPGHNANESNWRKIRFANDIVDKIRSSRFSELPFSLRLAMSSALGSPVIPTSDQGAMSQSLKSFKYYDTSFLQDLSKCTQCDDKENMEWVLCNYKSLGNNIQRGDNVEFLGIESSVYLVRDYNAPGQKAVGELDPAADVRMRSLIWVVPSSKSNQHNQSVLCDMVLVLQNEYIWKRQYLNEMDPTGNKLNAILYSKQVRIPFSKTEAFSTVGQHIQFSLKDHHTPRLTGSFDDIEPGVEHNTDQSESFQQIILRLSSSSSDPSVLVHRDRSQFLFEGMGAMLKTPKIHESHMFLTGESTHGHADKTETPELMDISYDSRILAELPIFILGTAPKTFPCIINRVEPLISATNTRSVEVELVVNVLLDCRWINVALMANLGHHSVLTTNLEMRVQVCDVERTFTVSPASLYSSSAQINARPDMHEFDEMFVIGHLDFSNGTGRKFSDNAVTSILNSDEAIARHGKIKYENTCVLLSLLEFHHMLHVGGVPQHTCGRKIVPVFRRTLPITPLQMVKLLAWRAVNSTMGGPSLERYRAELGQNIEVFARSKTMPKRKKSSSIDSSPNTVLARIPGRILMGLLGLNVPQGQMELKFVAGMLCAKISSLSALHKLLKHTMPSVIHFEGEESEMVFDFNDAEANITDGYVHLHPPVTFKWQMYPRTNPGAERVFGPSEGVCSVSFHSFELKNVHKCLVTTNRFRNSKNVSELYRVPH